MVLLSCWCCSSSVWLTVRLCDCAVACTSGHTIDRTQRTTASQHKSTNTVRCTHGFAMRYNKVLKIVNYSILSAAAAAVHTQHVHYWQSVYKSHSTALTPAAKKGRNGREQSISSSCNSSNHRPCALRELRKGIASTRRQVCDITSDASTSITSSAIADTSVHTTTAWYYHYEHVVNGLTAHAH
eukprot:7949-Heterococcus_DN1.PRE.9